MHQSIIGLGCKECNKIVQIRYICISMISYCKTTYTYNVITCIGTYLTEHSLNLVQNKNLSPLFPFPIFFSSKKNELSYYFCHFLVFFFIFVLFRIKKRGYLLLYIFLLKFDLLLFLKVWLYGISNTRIFQMLLPEPYTI